MILAKLKIMVTKGMEVKVITVTIGVIGGTEAIMIAVVVVEEGDVVHSKTAIKVTIMTDIAMTTTANGSSITQILLMSIRLVPEGAEGVEGAFQVLKRVNTQHLTLIKASINTRITVRQDSNKCTEYVART